MNVPGKIRVGIVGAGQNTCARHIPNLLAIEGVEIASVCNRSLESGKRVAQEFGITEVFSNWRDLIFDKEIDAVVIGTWPYLHCPVTLTAINAGKHVLCEARMAMNACEAHQMLNASRARPDVIAQLVPAPFTLFADAAIQRLIKDGYLGQLLAIEVRDGGKFIEPDAGLHWRQNVEYSGFNTMTLGIWYESIMRWVGEAISVSAKGSVFTKMRKDEHGFAKAVQIPEHLDVIADMACGAQLHIQISSVTGLGDGSQVWLFGSRGTLLLKGEKLYGGQKGQEQLAEIHIPAQEQGYWQVEQEFINAIRGTERFKLTKFEDGVKYMEFTEGVARSIQERCAISLPLK